jgi:hypothetical protein
MNRSVLLVMLIATGCESPTVPGMPGGSDPVPAAPSQAAEVTSTYQQIGNSCNDGQVTRTLTAVREIEADNVWSTPDADPASLATPRNTSGWGEIAAVAEITYDGFAERLTSTSREQAERCGGARDIFTPVTRDNRQHFMNLIMYAGDHAHLDRFPASGFVPEPVDAPVRLRGYLDVSSGIREEVAGGVLYRDVSRQHLPIAITCEKPLRVARLFRSVRANERQGIDPATCSNELCLFERFEHVADNRCTFVATDARYRSSDGTELRLSIGGRLETKPGQSDPVKYRVTVDRYAFHAL